jgi:ABC-2 type transport system permease protein
MSMLSWWAAVISRQVLMRNLRAAYARAYVRVRSQFNEPEWVIAEAVIPLLIVFAAATLYRVSGSGQLAGFAVVGGAMMAFWDNVLWLMASQLYWRRRAATSTSS